jgi:hypothetical protein
MPEVDFERLSPDQYEDMVAVLLSRIRQTHRVDGSGGDGGRDCYFTDADGTDAYELKSFTGRMNAARRRQVERSLRRGLRSSPRSWSLVVPIDATPTEQRWFDSPESGTTARLTWLARTWLRDQLAAHPDIGRYFNGTFAVAPVTDHVPGVLEIGQDIAEVGAGPAADRSGRVDWHRHADKILGVPGRRRSLHRLLGPARHAPGRAQESPVRQIWPALAI